MSAATLVLTRVTNRHEAEQVCRLIDSLRSFGGPLAGCPVWVFAPSTLDKTACILAATGAEIYSLPLPATPGALPFTSKVLACAHAEELAPAGTRTLLWIDPDCLIVQPPLLYQLEAPFAGALRPVHLRNVGLPAGAPLDAFWSGIYAAVGFAGSDFSVAPFLGGERLRPYFNSHAFSLDPALGLCRQWQEIFLRLSSDPTFLAAACADEPHRIFLFQAVLSALLATRLPAEHLRLLPPTYNYPYHLHERVPAEQRPEALNDLVTFVYEDVSLHPATLHNIGVRDPLRAWLAGHVPAID